MKALLGALLVLASVLPVVASFNVRNNFDSGKGSFRQAILDANASGGGKIAFHKVSGIINLQSSLPAFTTPITVIGPGANQLTVQGGGTYPEDGFPVFTNVAGNTATIVGMTVSETHSMLWSAVMNFGSLNFTNCNFSGGFSVNVAAAIYNTGDMNLRNCTFSGCGGFQGGAICNLGAMGLVSCTLTNNRGAGSGGCIYNAGSFALDNCTLANNGYFISGAGGAIYNDDGGTVALRNCSITDNYGVAGGGIWNSGSLAVTNCTLAQNHATYSSGPCPGGAIYNYSNATAILESTTVSGNTALDRGGGILNQGTLWLLNSTIVSNIVYVPEMEGPGEGGGVWNSGVVYSQNTIIAGNTAEQGPDFFGALVSGRFNLIQATAGITHEADATGNLLCTDPKLGHLQDSRRTPLPAQPTAQFVVQKRKAVNCRCFHAKSKLPKRDGFCACLFDGLQFSGRKITFRPDPYPGIMGQAPALPLEFQNPFARMAAFRL